MEASLAGIFASFFDTFWDRWYIEAVVLALYRLNAGKAAYLVWTGLGVRRQWRMEGGDEGAEGESLPNTAAFVVSRGFLETPYIGRPAWFGGGSKELPPLSHTPLAPW